MENTGCDLKEIVDEKIRGVYEDFENGLLKMDEVENIYEFNIQVELSTWEISQLLDLLLINFRLLDKLHYKKAKYILDLKDLNPILAEEKNIKKLTLRRFSGNLPENEKAKFLLFR